MRRLPIILAGIALALGLAHISLAALAPGAGSLGTLWFAGSGLAILVGGLLNLTMLRVERPDRLQKAAWLFANLALTAFFALALPLLPAPQTMVGTVVFALLALHAGRRVFVMS